MKKNIDFTNRKKRLKSRPGITADVYPLFSDGDDIFNKFHKEADLDPEEIFRIMDLIELDNLVRSSLRSLMANNSESNADLPGNDSDENTEYIGTEDEENK